MKKIASGAAAVSLLALIALATAAWRLNPSASSAREVAPSEPAGKPCFQIDEILHDFGVMETGESGSHVFTFRNTGDAPLKVEAAGTTCKCTMLNLQGNAVPPGETAEARVEWTADHATEEYRQGAILRTNDPEQKSIELKIDGRVRAGLACSPSEVTFSDMQPGEKRTATIIVYSQTWTDFQVKAINSEFSPVVRPADKDTLAKLKATSGYEVECSATAGDKPGLEQRSLCLVMTSSRDGKPSQKTLEVPVLLDVAPVVQFFAKKMQDGNRLDLGAIPRDLTTRHVVYVRAGSRDTSWKLLSAKSSDPAVRVSVGTREGAAQRLELEIPPQTDTASYRGANAVRIQIATDHSLAPTAELAVEFSVY